MSATGQAAGGDAGQAQAATGENGAAQTGGDLSQVLETLQQQGSSQEEMRNQLTSLAQWAQSQQAEPEAEAPEEPLDLSWLDPSEPGYDPDTAAQRMEQLLADRDRKNEERWAQQYVEPLRNDLQEIRMSQEMQDLAAEFPDIAENPDGFMDLTRQAAEQIGRPDLINNSGFMRLIRLAAAGAEAAQSEGAEHPQAAHLEGGGGATPTGGSQVDLGDQIVNAQPKRVLPFG
jgi:hypothetical protein